MEKVELYTISPHIIKNQKHFFKKKLKSVFSFGFLINLINLKTKIKILSWGLKTNQFIINSLKGIGLEIIYLEDGFYRSYNTGSQGDKSYSQVIDFSSIYYNSRKPSDLENILNFSILSNKKEIEMAREAISFIKYNKLSKYNNNNRLNDKIKTLRNILIVDQTFGDKSLKYGGVLSGLNIQQIVDDINYRYDKRYTIYIKVHPDVINGDKKSALGITDISKIVSKLKIVLIEENVNPVELMEEMEEINVLTSQMGFEALLLKKKVVTYGRPFYSGWGLTMDKHKFKTNRRSRTLSVEQLFLGACILYTNYINPKTEKKITIMEALESLRLEKINKF